MAASGLSFAGKPFFTPEEDQRLIHLKEKEKLSWAEIATHFTGRTKGTLQVRYSRKLHKRPRQRSQGEKRTKRTVNAEEPTVISVEQTQQPTDKVLEEQSEQKTENAVGDQTTLLTANHAQQQKQELTTAITEQKRMLRPIRSTPRQAMPIQVAADQEVPKQGGSKVEALARTQQRVAFSHNPEFTEDRAMATAKSCRAAGSRSAKAQPGWNVIVPLERSGADFMYPTAIPDVFVNPPPTHVIEYNTRSGSYRIRRRREDDAGEAYKVLSCTTGPQGVSADGEGNSLQPPKRRKTAVVQGRPSHAFTYEPTTSSPLSQTWLVKSSEPPARSRLAGAVVQDSDGDSELSDLGDSVSGGASASSETVEEDLDNLEGLEVARRDSEGTDSASTSGPDA